MKKRQAKKILKQLTTGRPYRSWRRSTLYAANDALFGTANRGMISFILFTRASEGAGKAALAFAEAIKQVGESMKKFVKQSNAELST